jgi:sirohydrochlorin ferrochelatase
MPDNAQTAVLLIAHGSRSEPANADTRHFAEELARRGPHPIAVAAFLELAEPDIDAGAARCVELGASRVILLPHFLSAGIHVGRDLTAACERLAARYPRVDFRLAEPLGRHPLLLDILSERAREAFP